MMRNSRYYQSIGLAILWLLGSSSWAEQAPPSYMGSWLSELRREGGGGVTLEFTPDNRVHLALGIVLGAQWELKESKGNEFLIDLINPADPQDRISATIRVKQGRKTSMVVRSTNPRESWKHDLVSRGEQPEQPPFLGRWGFVIEGVPGYRDIHQDGWMWIHADFQATEGHVHADGDRLLFEWPDQEPGLIEVRLEGESLVAVFDFGSEVRFLRPKEALKLPVSRD